MISLRWKIALLAAFGFVAAAQAQSGLIPQNQVWAGPTSGGQGYARARAIVAADLPNGGAPQGAAGGGLAGTYPNPTVAAVPASALPAFTGDVTKPAGSVATTVTKINGATPAASATTDTTNAANINSGTLPVGRLPVGASAQSAAVSPTGTASTTGLMMGLGGSSGCNITPATTGRIHFVINGSLTNTAIAGVTASLRTGTGTPPANAGALVGTVSGAAAVFNAAVATARAPFSLTGLLTGQTVGTAIWEDLSISVTSGTGSATASCTMWED